MLVWKDMRNLAKSDHLRAIAVFCRQKRRAASSWHTNLRPRIGRKHDRADQARLLRPGKTFQRLPEAGFRIEDRRFHSRAVEQSAGEDHLDLIRTGLEQRGD